MKVFINDKNNGPIHLLTFSIDVELYGFLMSLYQYGCKNALFGTEVQKDWISLAQEFGILYDISSSESNSSVTPISGKTTGILAVLGLGSWLCYRFFQFSKKTSRLKDEKPDSFDHSKSHYFSIFGQNSHLKTSYFGPRSPASDIDDKGNQFKKDAISSCDSDWSPLSVNRYKSRKMKKKQCRGWLLNRKPFNFERIYLRSSDSMDQSAESSPNHYPYSIKRDESIDSMCSDISLDISGMVETGSTVAKMDQLQEEIELLKSNCLSMDEEFETIKTTRKLPGLSSLLSSTEANSSQNEASARACFKGLYSLTTINRSMSFDLSNNQSMDEDISPFNSILTPLSQTEEESSSLEWDSQDTNAFAISSAEKFQGRNVMVQSTPTDTILPMDISWSGDSFDLLDSPSGNNNQCNKIFSSQENESSKFSETSNFSNINKINKGIIGPLVPLSPYKNEFFKCIPCDNVIKKLEDKITDGSYKFVGSVYEDSSNFLRSSLFLILCRGLPVPKGQTAMNVIMQAIETNPLLFTSWNFGAISSYDSDPLKGMKICLNTLDSVVSCLLNSENRIESLIAWINTDPTLDSHIVEAAKLIMVASVLSPDSKINSNHKKVLSFLSDNLSFYEKIGIVTEFISNINNPRSFQLIPEMACEVKLNLFGFTFGVVLDVINLSAQENENCVKLFPDVSFDWPHISLLTEDYEHFQIIV